MRPYILAAALRQLHRMNHPSTDVGCCRRSGVVFDFSLCVQSTLCISNTCKGAGHSSSPETSRVSPRVTGFAPSSPCTPRGLQTMALQQRLPSIVSPSWLHSSNAHLIYVKWDKGILAHRERRALISFHLAPRHRTSLSAELLLDSIKMYGLPNMFKWLFGPHHHREKANKICPIHLNRDGKEVGGDGSS